MNARNTRVAVRSASGQAPWLREGAGYLLAIIVVGTQLFAGLTFVMFH
jgi:hypothetical protein